MSFLASRVRRDFLRSCEEVSRGQLLLKTPEGTRHRFGFSGPEVELHILDWRAVTMAAAHGDAGWGRAYVEGLWDASSIEGLTRLALENLPSFEDYAYASPLQGVKYRLADQLMRRNSRRGAGRNIRAHYDTGNEFFQLWLDPSMTYSSALFAPGDDDLERGQMRKYDRILDNLGEGERLLEVGCGWGGFAERAAGQGRHVTGLTLSPAQKSWAEARLDGRADIRLQDYRDVGGQYDGIVSIEMIEAVGEKYWPVYFETLRARLSEGGKAMLQAITVPDTYYPTYRSGTDYIRQHVFPGGQLPSRAEISAAAERAGLVLKGSFSFGHDYALTCRTWQERIDAEERRIAALGYGEAFLRSWRYYLAICAAAFDTRQTDVLQLELVRAS